MIGDYLRTFAKTGIAVFCVWHMAAVGLYSLPDDSDDRFTNWAEEHLIPHVSEYMLLTSQWQQWNLFSPNPLRRIVFYRVETLNPYDEWAYVTSLNHTTYGPFRHAARFKLLGQALEENTDRPELAERAAQVLCDELGLDPEGRIRIWHEVTIVPYVHPSPSKDWWDKWKPQFEPSLAYETDCQP